MGRSAPYVALIPLLLIPLLVTSLAVPTRAEIEFGDAVMSGSAEVSGLPQSVEGSKAGFEEYRDIPETVVVPEIQFMIGGKKEDFYLNFDSTKPGLDDQNFKLRFGRYGIVDFEFEWDQIPHFFSSATARTPYRRKDAGGTYTLSSKPASTAGNDVRDWVDTTATALDLKLFQGVGRARVRYTPTPGWTFKGGYSAQHVAGKRAFGAYFGPNPGQYNITELFEPIDYLTQNIEAGGEYAGDGWSVALNYNGSLFHNRNSSLVWDNPLQLSGIGSDCEDQLNYNTASGMFGSCRGRFDLYPSNQAHTFALSGGAVLPWKSHVSGTVSYGWRTQDDSFLPFTINDKVTEPSISRKSLDGDVRPLLVTATVVNRFFERLGLKATYRYYDFDNRSKRVLLADGYITNDAGNPNGTALKSFPYSYSKHDVGLEASYRVVRSLNTKFNYLWQNMHREEREVLNSNEFTFGPTVDWTPKSWLLVRSSYRRSLRDAPNYDAGRNAAIYLDETDEEARKERLGALRKFDEAARDRDNVNLFAQISPLDHLTAYAAFDFTNDRYPGSPIGLKKRVSYVPSIGFNYAPFDWISFFADYNWDKNNWSMKAMNRSAQLTEGCPARVDQTPSNCPSSVWTSQGTDRVNTVGVGSEMTVIKDRMKFRIDYTFSHAKSKIRASGDTTTGNVPATDFPRVTSQWQQLLASVEYKITKHIALRFGYYFNRFQSNDFGLDVMKPWMGDVDTGANVQRSIFLGDNVRKPYTAHVGFVGLKVGF
jgi:MtrB/PioB family decaheme-associated outer membrane protein